MVMLNRGGSARRGFESRLGSSQALNRGRAHYKVQGQERAAEVDELLKSPVEIVGQPLTKAKLHEHEKAPCEHGWQNRRRFALEELRS